MKQLLILILASVLSIGSYAQSVESEISHKKSGVNQLGLNLFNITKFSKDYDLFYLNNKTKYLMNHHYLNGITYKRALNNYSLRLGLDIYMEQWDNEESSTYAYHRDSGSLKSGELRLGLQRNFHFKNLNLFIASDMVFSYVRKEGVNSSAGDIIWWLMEHPYNDHIFEFGFAPAIGFDYKFSKRFSTTLEMNLSMNRSFLYDHRDTDPEAHWNLYFNPIRVLALNYHF